MVLGEEQSGDWVKRVWTGLGLRLRLGGAGNAGRPGAIGDADACAHALWNSSTGFENYKKCLEKVNLHIYTFAAVCIYNRVIIQTSSEYSMSVEAPGILSTELMIFYLELDGVRVNCRYSF